MPIKFVMDWQQVINGSDELHIEWEYLNAFGLVYCRYIFFLIKRSYQQQDFRLCSVPERETMSQHA